MVKKCSGKARSTDVLRINLFDMREEIWRLLRLKYPKFRPVDCNAKILEERF